MNKEELEILQETLKNADSYFTYYCEVTDRYVYSQDEIDKIEDEDERNEAQENKDYNDLLEKAQNIINKYMED